MHDGRMFSRTPRLRLSLALATLALLSAGCLLYPMADPETTVMDKRLLGRWVDAKGQKAYVFLPHDKRSYTVLITSRKPDPANRNKQGKWTVTDVAKGFVVETGGQTYLNLQPLGPGLVYNPDQHAPADLDTLAKMFAGDDKGEKSIDQAVRRKRIAAARKGLIDNGVHPFFIVAKLKLSGRQMSLQDFDMPDQKAKAEFEAFLSLDSIEATRKYIVTKAKWKKAATYTFHNEAGKE